MTERERLEFVQQRDGDSAANRFAEQTLAVYVTDSVKHGPHKDSIAACTKWLEEDGEYEVILVYVRRTP